MGRPPRGGPVYRGGNWAARATAVMVFLLTSAASRMARLVALLRYLQAAVEDITEMDNLNYTPQLTTTNAGLIQVREGPRIEVSAGDTPKELVQQPEAVRKEEEQYKELTTLWGELRRSFHDEMKQAAPSGGTSAPP